MKSIFGKLAVSMTLLVAGCATPQQQVANYQEAFYAAESNVWQCVSESVAKYDLLAAKLEKSESERLIDRDFLSEPERSQMISFQREREECQNVFRSTLSAGGYSLTYPVNTESWWSSTNAVTASLLSREITWGQYFKARRDDYAGQQLERDRAIRNAWDDAAHKERAANEELRRAFQQLGGGVNGSATVRCKEFGDVSLAPVVHTFNATQCPVGYSPL